MLLFHSLGSYKIMDTIDSNRINLLLVNSLVSLTLFILAFWLLTRPIEDIGPSDYELSVITPTKVSSQVVVPVQTDNVIEPEVVSEPVKNESNSLVQEKKVIEEKEILSMEDVVALIQDGDWEKAEQILLEISKREPNNETVFVELAMIQLVDKGDPEAAKPYLRQAAKIRPDSPVVISELVAVYSDTDNLDDAIKFLKVLPGADNGAINYGIGSSLLANGDAESAISYLEKSLERGGADIELIQEEMAEAYIQTERVEEAMQVWDSLLQSTQDQDTRREITFRKASVIRARGNIQDSLDLMKDYIEAHPEDRYAKEYLQHMQEDKG